MAKVKQQELDGAGNLVDKPAKAAKAPKEPKAPDNKNTSNDEDYSDTINEDDLI